MANNILETLREARRATEQLQRAVRHHDLTEDRALRLLQKIDTAFDQIMGRAAISRATGELRADEADKLLDALRTPASPFTVIDGGRP